MRMPVGKILLAKYLLLAVATAACAPRTVENPTCYGGENCIGSPCTGESADFLRPEGWGALSHCGGAAPDYAQLFADSDPATMTVHRFDISISEEVYQQTMADLEGLFGAQTCSGPPPPPGAPVEGDPMWAPVDVHYNGETWWRVGMRYKGNSSLRLAWLRCKQKLAFRLDFDQYEDLYPSLNNQRFFGFKKMTFANAFGDPSMMRDKLAADIFRRSGIPAARGAFARVYVTIGEAEPVYFGLYTMIEDPSNRMLDSQFVDDGGNLYKPESKGPSTAGKWGADATAEQIQNDFVKKTNEEFADWSDVTAAIDALHDGRRLTSPAQWRANLEDYFNVDGFLNQFAVGQAMVNWDSYGCIAHNYYLYADVGDATASAPLGRLTWFPWDLNQAMQIGGICDYSSQEALIPDAAVIGDAWPLIRYLLDDATYLQTYKDYLAATISQGGAFDATWVKARIDAYHDLVAPYVMGPEAVEQAPYSFLRDTAAFDNAAVGLREHVDRRALLVRTVLGL